MDGIDVDQSMGGDMNATELVIWGLVISFIESYTVLIAQEGLVWIEQSGNGDRAIDRSAVCLHLTQILQTALREIFQRR